jgi:hypothetical protein
MADIFISYTKKDRSNVEPLAKALENLGWTVWWDPIIPTGEDFDDVIEKELAKARCVIVVWTKTSVRSKYVKGEAREALDRNILIPIEIESGIKPPYDLRSIQTLSLIEWDGSDNFPRFQKLIADIIRILGEPPLEVQKRQREEEERKRAEEERRRKQEEDRKLREKEQRKAEENQRNFEKSVAIITLYLDSDPNCFFEYSLKNQERFHEGSGMFKVDSNRMYDLKHRSKQIDTIDNWEKALKMIGSELEKEIFANNYKLTQSLYRMTGILGNDKIIRIKFKVGKEFHSIALEAMLEDNVYRMLEQPIYRQALPEISNQRNSLFFRQETTNRRTNCLIIESALPGGAYVPKLETELAHLGNVPIESEWLEQNLQYYRDEWLIGRIERINESKIPAGKTFREYLQGLLENDEWHLVHYAGHSFYDEAYKNGYVFFPEDNGYEALDINMFSKWLRNANASFLYLTRSPSSTMNILFQFAQQGIPAIMGFRWDIYDEKAAIFAERFYNHLFRIRACEYALLETRKDMYVYWERDKVWASPVLYMN